MATDATDDATVPVLQLCELPDDQLMTILTKCAEGLTPLGAAMTLSRLASACRRMRDLVARDPELWDGLIRQGCVIGCEKEQDVIDRSKCSPRALVTSALRPWLRYASQLEIPSLQQMVACVERSANAHSYYKHLNISRSACFSFHLSQVAGMRRTADGFIAYVRGDGTEFHYTWTPTAEYRKAFGQLVYEDGGPRHPTSLPQPLPSHTLHSASGEAVWQPQYVVEAGAAMCSAAVHDTSQDYYRKTLVVLQAVGRDALEGVVVRTSEVSDARLQRRHMDSDIIVPTCALEALAACEERKAEMKEAFALLCALSFDELLDKRQAADEKLKPQLDVLYDLANAVFSFLPCIKARLALLKASHQCKCRGGITVDDISANLAEVAERVAERWGLLQACARVVGHVIEAQGASSAAPPDLAPIFEGDMRLFFTLCGLRGERWREAAKSGGC